VPKITVFGNLAFGGKLLDGVGKLAARIHVGKENGWCCKAGYPSTPHDLELSAFEISRIMVSQHVRHDHEAGGKTPKSRVTAVMGCSKSFGG